MNNKKLDINKILLPSLLVIIILLLLLIIVVFFKDRDDLNYIKSNSTSNNENINSIPDDYNNSDLNNDNNDINDSSSDSISKQDALNVALKDINVKQEDIYDLDIELDYKYGQNVYEIDFNYGQYEYEYYVSVKDGKIIKAFRERD